MSTEINQTFQRKKKIHWNISRDSKENFLELNLLVILLQLLQNVIWIMITMIIMVFNAKITFSSS